MKSFKQYIEMRQGALRYLKNKHPNIPDYIVKDTLYRGLKAQTGTAADAADNVRIGAEDLNGYNWELKTIKITLDIFNDKTIKRMHERQFGKINPYGVPKDAERHQTQQELLKKQGVSKEPIIVTLESDGKYDLWEGWHRTLQALQVYPQGYMQKAWVGTEK